MAASDKEQVENFYEFGLDPLHWAFVKLFIRDVLELSENKALPGMEIASFISHYCI